MNSPKTALIVLGTRPEAIKMAPIILAARESSLVIPVVCSTGQHAHMVRPVAEFFGFDIDMDFGIMKPNQTLNHITSSVIAAMGDALTNVRPDWCVVQGDTTTTFSAAMAAFNCGVPVAHVEAGLRTGDLHSPWPEEANRVLVSRISALHFPPTALSESNLLAEGIPAARVYNVGNTVIDAAKIASSLIGECPPALEKKYGPLPAGRTILFTMHRRESLGTPMERVFIALRALAEQHEVRVIFPMHPNPKVREPAQRILGDCANVQLVEPLSYDELIHVLRTARFVLTDSGGIVEEAAAFNKPALVLRETTERTESVDAGSAILCGTDGEKIERLAGELLADSEMYRRMTTAPNPYGDGTAACQIVEILGQATH